MSKKWAGLLTEVFTDKDNFAVEFLDAQLGEDERRARAGGRPLHRPAVLRAQGRRLIAVACSASTRTAPAGGRGRAADRRDRNRSKRRGQRGQAGRDGDEAEQAGRDELVAHQAAVAAARCAAPAAA